MKIEGRNAVLEALKSGNTIDKVLIQNSLRDEPSKSLVAAVKERGCKFQYVEKAVIDKEAPGGKSQGFIAYVSDYKYYELDEATEGAEFVLVLDGIEDPHNFGSILRVAECGGVTAVVIGKHRSACVTDTVMRISEGSANHVKVARVTNINSAVEALKKDNFWVYALETGGENIYKSDLKGKLALVIGGEDSGVNALTRSKCDRTLSIPMYGKLNSLNASVATGIAVFEAARQRNA